jgi:hypothetical protein
VRRKNHVPTIAGIFRRFAIADTWRTHAFLSTISVVDAIFIA